MLYNFHNFSFFKLQSDSEPDVPSAANITPPLSTDGAPMLSGKKQSFLQIVQRSSEAVQKGDFHRAVQLYSEGLALDPANHILFSNRSAAYVKLGLYKKALQDARRAIELNSSWAKVSLLLSADLFWKCLIAL